jgi:predicted Zn-ribbon and HTH transcriptional regulator
MTDRIKYKCNNCRYEFTRKTVSKVMRCPYCANTDSVEVDSGNYAEKLIDTVN